LHTRSPKETLAASDVRSSEATTTFASARRRNRCSEPRSVRGWRRVPTVADTQGFQPALPGTTPGCRRARPRALKPHGRGRRPRRPSRALRVPAASRRPGDATARGRGPGETRGGTPHLQGAPRGAGSFASPRERLNGGKRLGRCRLRGDGGSRGEPAGGVTSSWAPALPLSSPVRQQPLLPPQHLPQLGEAPAPQAATRRRHAPRRRLSPGRPPGPRAASAAPRRPPSYRKRRQGVGACLVRNAKATGFPGCGGRGGARRRARGTGGAGRRAFARGRLQ